MKCQILFSGKNKKNIINLSSAENAQRAVKVNSSWTVICDKNIYCFVSDNPVNKIFSLSWETVPL